MKLINYSPIISGLLTGLTLQFAVGPVFFYIVSLTIRRSFADGAAGVLAVTMVDFFYITLAILGIGKLLEQKKYKKIFGVVSSLVLAVFGFVIIYWAVSSSITNTILMADSSLLASFISVFLLAISSPLTIVFFTSLFTTKATEYGYTKKELLYFGIGTGLATLLFMGTAVVGFSLVRSAVPAALVMILNLLVGLLLVGYGLKRSIQLLRITSD